MSHSGWSASNYITLNGTKPSAVPLTLHARYKASAFTATARLVSVYFDASNAFRLCVTSGQKAFAQTQAGSAGNAVGATSIGTGWVSLVARFTSATDRKIFLNGAQDATEATSLTPTGTTTATIGQDNGSFPALGSIAEVAIWNVALSDEDIAALAYTSPLLIRPDALVCYIPLLDSGTLDYMAPAATVTGTLTKDNDHPSVIYPRRRNKVALLKVAGGGGASNAVGTSDGVATTAGIGASLAAAAAASAGVATAQATGTSVAAAVYGADGIATATGIGAFTGTVDAVASSSGTSTATGVGAALGGTEYRNTGYGGKLHFRKQAKIDHAALRRESRKQLLRCRDEPDAPCPAPVDDSPLFDLSAFAPAPTPIPAVLADPMERPVIWLFEAEQILDTIGAIEAIEAIETMEDLGMES